MKKTNRLWLPLATSLFVLFLLIPVQLKVEKPMLILERFLPGGGWIEIVLITFYGAIVAYHMQDPAGVSVWRRYTWLAFSVVFFSQLILGLSGFEKFLMTGKLHLCYFGAIDSFRYCFQKTGADLYPVRGLYFLLSHRFHKIPLPGSLA